MKKTVVIIISIISITILIGLYIWVTHHRFYAIQGAQGVAYEVDKKTGESWVLFGALKSPQQKKEKKYNGKEKELPFVSSDKITGNASLGEDYFSGKIYNGSDWIVTRVIVRVSAIESDGTVRWSRDFSAPVTINPLTTEPFSVMVSGSQGIKKWSWDIIKVFGYKE